MQGSILKRAVSSQEMWNLFPNWDLNLKISKCMILMRLVEKWELGRLPHKNSNTKFLYSSPEIEISDWWKWFYSLLHLASRSKLSTSSKLYDQVPNELGEEMEGKKFVTFVRCMCKLLTTCSNKNKNFLGSNSKLLEDSIHQLITGVEEESSNGT